jgi:hypothetical protein
MINAIKIPGSRCDRYARQFVMITEIMGGAHALPAAV